MTFTRTPAGLANYKAFFQAAVVVYTEGKAAESGDSGATPDDQIFYEALLGHLLPGARVKVKCVGNRDAALDYAEKIAGNGVKGEIVCIDRDLCGVTHSLRPMKCVVQTNGYSWENDLWTVPTCERLLAALTHSQPPGLHEKVRRLVRRLRLLFVLDAALQPHGLALVNKSTSQGGIGFAYASRHLVPIREITRLTGKYRSSPATDCPISAEVLRTAASLPASRLIQGHIWSNAIRGLIAYFYKQQTKETGPSKRMLLNLALAQLKADVVGVMGTVSVQHYADAVQAALA
jgi:hypothetical protein